MIPLDIAPLISEYAIPGGVQVERYGPQQVDELGQVVDPEPTMLTIQAAVHVTTSKRALARLPESDRTRETIAVYTNDAIFTAGDARPDVVHYRDRRYEVTAVSDYELQGGVYLTLAQLIEEAD
jgi:hypothetical protein